MIREMVKDRLANIKLRLSDRTLFVFGGCLHHWAGMGSTLYQQEKVFCDSIRETDQLIRNEGLPGILQNFEGNISPDYFNDGTRDYTITAAIHMALTDLWKSKGVFPSAVMGQSQGEVTALYAANALGKRDVIRIVGAMAVHRLPKEYISLIIQTGLHDSIFSNCPRPLFPTYETTKDQTIAICQRSDRDAVESFLKEQGIQFHLFTDMTFSPLHSRLMREQMPAFRTLTKDIVPQPLSCDFYACSQQAKIPAHNLIPYGFFERLQLSPVYMHATTNIALHNKYNTALCISTNAFLLSSLKKFVDAESIPVYILNSFDESQVEDKQFRQTFSDWKKINRFSFFKGANQSNDTDQFQFFINEIGSKGTMDHEDWLSIFKYLRTTGSIQFLPKYSGWMVLDHALAETILKDTDSYSNRPYHYFDTSLLGTDPPEHTEIKALIQHQFLPKSIKELNDFALSTIISYFESISDKEEFDMAKDVIIPTILAVNCRFMGIPLSAVDLLLDTLPGGEENPDHQIKQWKFFEDYLREHQHNPANEGMMSILMGLVSSEKIAFERAVGLMKLIWNAGSGTTFGLLTHLTHQLMVQPDLAGRLISDPELIPNFLDESLRLYANPFVPRLTVRDVKLNETTIPAGNIILISPMAANRDPKMFTDPDEMVLERSVKKNFAFGFGPHHCLGSHVSKMVATHFIKTSMKQADEYELKPFTNPTFLCRVDFNGATSMPMRRKPK